MQGTYVRSLFRELDPTRRNKDSMCHNQGPAWPNKFQQTNQKKKNVGRTPAQWQSTDLADISVARPSRTLNKQVAELSSGRVKPTSISTLSKLLADLFFHPGRTMPLLFQQPPCVWTNSLNLCSLKYETQSLIQKLWKELWCQVEAYFLKGGSTLKTNPSGQLVTFPNEQCLGKGTAGCLCSDSCSIKIGHRTNSFVSLTKWYPSPHYEDLRLLLKGPKQQVPLTPFWRLGQLSFLKPSLCQLRFSAIWWRRGSVLQAACQLLHHSCSTPQILCWGNARNFTRITLNSQNLWTRGPPLLSQEIGFLSDCLCQGTRTTDWLLRLLDSQMYTVGKGRHTHMHAHTHRNLCPWQTSIINHRTRVPSQNPSSQVANVLKTTSSNKS